MAKKAVVSKIVSLKSLRSELNDPQRNFLNLFWDHYVDYGQWPTTFDIHRKSPPNQIADCLQPLGGDIVWERSDSPGNRYELHLIGMLLTKDGELYESWLVRLLEFLREKYLQEKEDGETFEFDEVEIGQALTLNAEESQLLGNLTRFENDYRSYSHTVGGNWKIGLPKEIQEIPRTGSLKDYHEGLLFKYFKRETPVSQKERQAHLLSKTGSMSNFPVSGYAAFSEITEKPKELKKANSKSAKIFVSHSNQDKELVQALTDLLKAAFRLPAKDILCTSVPGHKLAGGADTEDELLALLRDARLLIGVITPASLSSSYVLFELGARWGLQKPHIPLVASGAGMSDIKEPLKAKNALNAADQDDALQLIEDVARYLNLKSEPVSAYNAKVRQLVSIAKARKTEASNVAPNLPKPNSSKLHWAKLIERMTLTTESRRGGAELFYHLAKRGGLKPFMEAPVKARWRSTMCAGVSLTERENYDLPFEDDTKNKDADVNYELEIAPDLLDRSGPLIDAWYKKAKNILPLRLLIRFPTEVSIENASHRITSNIFQTELSMTDKDTFELKKHWFCLQRTQHSRSPVFEMTIWKGFKSIPWSEIFTALVTRKILLIEKSLAKELWS